MQPQELDKLIAGYEWRIEQEVNIKSYYIANLLNVSGKTLKKDIKPSDLSDCILGKKRKGFTEEEKARLREEFKHKFNKDGEFIG